MMSQKKKQINSLPLKKGNIYAYFSGKLLTDLILIFNFF